MLFSFFFVTIFMKSAGHTFVWYCRCIILKTSNVLLATRANQVSSLSFFVLFLCHTVIFHFARASPVPHNLPTSSSADQLTGGRRVCRSRNMQYEA